MSSHPKRRERRDADFYPTPRAVTDPLVRLLDIRIEQRVLEPSCGSGNWIRSLWDHHTVLPDAVELYPERYPELVGAPVRQLWKGRFEDYIPDWRYDWIVGNPPYDRAVHHVQQALFLLRPGGHAAMLLRSGFSHTAERALFIRQFPPWREYALTERPPFDDSGQTDSTEYVFYVWRRGWTGDTVRRYVSWKDPELYALDRQRIIDVDWAVTDRWSPIP